MEDVRIYDSNFNLIHIENKVISSNWSVHFNDVGNFEIHMLPETEAAEIIMNNFDFENDKIPVVVQGTLQGIVTGIRICDDFTVYGRTCNWLLTRKVTPAFKSSELDIVSTPENIARYVVEKAFYDQENFVLGDKIGMVESGGFWRNTYHYTSDVVSEVLMNEYCGHNIFFDTKNKRWVFNVLPARKTDLILSAGNKNAYDTEYVLNCDKFYSACWYEQEQEFADGEFPDPVWTYIKKHEKTGIYRAECILDTYVGEEAENTLRKSGSKENITTGITDIKEQEDYMVGDIVRVQYIYGNIRKTRTKQITGENIAFEKGSESRQVILSNYREDDEDGI